MARPYLHEGSVHAISLDPLLEQRMLEVQRSSEAGHVLALDPDTGGSLIHQLDRLVGKAESRGVRPVLTCAPMIRPALRRFLRPTMSSLPVLSYTELVGGGQITSAGVVSMTPQAVMA